MLRLHSYHPAGDDDAGGGGASGNMSDNGDRREWPPGENVGEAVVEEGHNDLEERRSASVGANMGLGIAMPGPPDPESSMPISAQATPSNGDDVDAASRDPDVETPDPQLAGWHSSMPMRANWDGMFAEVDGYFTFYGERAMITNFRAGFGNYCHDFQFFEEPGSEGGRTRVRTFDFLIETAEGTTMGP